MTGMRKWLWMLCALVVATLTAEADAACTYPQGSVGTQVANPAIGYITSVVLEPGSSSKWRATYTYNDPNDGPPFSDVIDFGDGTGGAGGSVISGPGWTGSKITSISFIFSPGGGCNTFGSNKICLQINGAHAFVFNASGALLGSNRSFPDGVTKIRGMGPTGTNKLRWYHVTSGGVQGLDSNLLYSSCTASLERPTDWRYALAPRRQHPDALTIERLLHG